MKVFSRIDVLGLIPEYLAKSFIILVDDAERSGESHTIEEIKKKLEVNKIKYVTASYIGNKNVVVICSTDNKFFTTL